MDRLNKLGCKDLVTSLPNLCFEKNKLCEACQKGKKVNVSFKSKNCISTNKSLQRLHMDLFCIKVVNFLRELICPCNMGDYSRHT